MRRLIILMPILFTVTLFGQGKTVTKDNNSDTVNTVSFIVKFNKRNATKGGYLFGGYVVNIGYDQSKGLIGKTIRITGKASIEKGLESDTLKTTENDHLPIRQGRLQDIKHIESPIIQIVKNKN